MQSNLDANFLGNYDVTSVFESPVTPRTIQSNIGLGEYSTSTIARLRTRFA